MHTVPEFLSALTSDFEVVSCPLCGSDGYEPVFDGVALRGNQITLVICLECTHLFINPRPTLEALKAFYLGESYFELCAGYSGVDLDEKMAQFDDDEFWRARFVHGEQLHATYLDGRLNADDLVFDFGCGDGSWLWALREITGCRVAGEEISAVYADVVRKKLGIDLFLGPIEEVGEAIAQQHGDQARLVIVSGSLQHMVDPMYCLDVARRILREDGLLFLANWNILLHYMASYEGDRRRLLGDTLSWEHPQYFHETSFRYMIERAGFEIEGFEIESQVRPRHMGAFARKVVIPSDVRPIRGAHEVVAQLRSLESATVAERLKGLA